MIKRLYLDSRDWINLARISNGKEKDPVLINVYEKIRKLSNASKVIVPFSMFHLEDVMKNSNQKQREELIDFIISISNGYVMKPFREYFKKEIENAIFNHLGANPIHDVKSQIIGQGIAYLAGQEYFITSPDSKIQKFLDEKNDELRNLANSIETMKKLLKQEDFSSFIKNGRKEYVKLASILENKRQLRLKLDKTLRYKEGIVDYFFNIVIPQMAEILLNNKIKKDAISFKTKEDIELFLERMPSINSFYRLSFARDEESPERKIQPNDLLDISHLAGAVPYCDIVVMEKMFASLCRKVKIDKKYGCIVLDQLRDLDEIL
jgi:hypothetical protein